MLQDTEARIKELKGDAEQCAGRLFSLSQELQKTVMELSRKDGGEKCAAAYGKYI